jgi:hypothetical protein
MGEIYRAQRSWAERAYPELIYFNEVDKCGHFAAWGSAFRSSLPFRVALRRADQSRTAQIAQPPDPDAGETFHCTGKLS